MTDPVCLILFVCVKGHRLNNLFVLATNSIILVSANMNLLVVPDSGANKLDYYVETLSVGKFTFVFNVVSLISSFTSVETEINVWNKIKKR